VRIGLGALYTKRADGRVKAINLTLDYLLNFTAIGSARYENFAPFEIYGLAGIDVNYGQYHTNDEAKVEKAKGLGMHVGIRGQYHLSDYTYLYLEPRVGLLQDILVSGNESPYGYRPVVSLSAGMGYDLLQRGVRRKVTNVDIWNKNFFNRIFVTAFGGPQLLVTTAVGNFKDDIGVRGGIGFGKWFSPALGLRFIGAMAVNKDHVSGYKMKAFTGSAELMWNMHQTFGGYNPNRKYWVNAVMGPSLTFFSKENGIGRVFGFGAGLQPTFSLAGGGLELYLEPRLDLYEKDYAEFHGISHNWKLVGSMLAGFNITNGSLLTRKEVRERNHAFKNLRFFDNMFVEASVGLNTTLNGAEVAKGKNLMPIYEIAFGKWFSSVSGVRLRAQAGILNIPINWDNPSDETRMKHIGLGLDYLFNFSNATTGYSPERGIDFIGVAGIDLTGHTGRWTPSFGVHVGAQALWRLNGMYALFVEPRAYIYDDNYLERTTNSQLKKDVILSFSGGLHVDLRGYESKREFDLYNGGENPHFVTFAGGLTTHGGQMSDWHNYGFTGRIGFGRWFSPISAWRTTLQVSLFKKMNFDGIPVTYSKAKLGFDYIIDASAFTYGYNPERFFSLRPLLGATIGTNYLRSEGTLAFDVHAGLQLALRVSKYFEIFGEGVLAYELHTNPLGNTFSRRLNMFQPTALVGFNSYMGGANSKTIEHNAPEHRSFVLLSAGGGLNSEGYGLKNATIGKPTLSIDFSYGHWFTGLHGYQIGVSNFTKKRNRKVTKNITSLHLDYMFNLLEFLTRENELKTNFRLSLLAGVSGNIGSTTGHKATYALGFEGGLRAGYAVSSRVEIFAQPMGQFLQKTIHETSINRTGEAYINLNLGLKYAF
ncbi:MAG: hypothetical protein IJT13_01400, partial [Bacteroidaceae bacterium]|nr:hypothetical protein [Bacteroidaceae bacterium]